MDREQSEATQSQHKIRIAITSFRKGLPLSSHFRTHLLNFARGCLWELGGDAFFAKEPDPGWRTLAADMLLDIGSNLCGFYVCL